MGDARIVFFAGLAGLLTAPSRDGEVGYPVDRRASIKDVLEALGVPHTEVYRIEADGVERDFSWMLEPGCRVRVFGAEGAVDPTRPTLLRPVPLPGLRFAVDENVARLAMLLRLLGYDAASDRRWTDVDLAAAAQAEGRVVLSRDRALLKRRQVAWGRLVRECRPRDQLIEVMRLFGLSRSGGPFRRCLRCNAPLTPVSKQSVLHLLKPKTRLYYQDFSQCGRCRRVYWAGSHHAHMTGFLEGLPPESPTPPSALDKQGQRL